MDPERLAVLIEGLRAGRIIVGPHAQRRMRRHAIASSDILDALTAVEEVEVIEDYPYEPRGHCCLVVGWTAGRALHVVVTVVPSPFVITTYWPDSQPEKWSADFRRRRT